MQAYTYDRKGDGYLFTIYKPRHQGLVLALFPLALIAGILTFGIALVAWLIWALMRLFKNKAGSEITYTHKVVGTLMVSPDKLTTSKGKQIPVARLHSINIKNGYDKGFEVATGRSSGGGWIVGGALGAGMAAADGVSGMSRDLRTSVQNQRGKTAFYVVAEFGGQEEKLTTMDMSEVGARGLQNDILRVLEGHTL